jgi:hypothetical protein
MAEDYIQRVQLISSAATQEKVLLLDDFEGLLKWSKTATDANATITKDGSIALNGSYSLKLFCGDDSPAANDYTQARRFFPNRRNRTLDAQCCVYLPDVSAVKYFDFVVTAFKNTKLFTAGVQIDIANNCFNYYDFEENWTDLEVATHFLEDDRWYHLRFKIDLETGLYTAGNICDFDLALNGKVMFYAQDNEKVKTLTYVRLTAADNTAPSAYIDDLVITE